MTIGARVVFIEKQNRCENCYQSKNKIDWKTRINLGMEVNNWSWRSHPLTQQPNNNEISMESKNVAIGLSTIEGFRDRFLW